MNLMKHKLDSSLSQLEMDQTQKAAILDQAQKARRPARGRRTMILALGLVCLLGISVTAAAFALRGGVTSAKNYGQMSWNEYRQHEAADWDPNCLPKELTHTTPPDWWGDAETRHQKVDVVMDPQPWEPTPQQLEVLQDRISASTRVDLPVVEYTLPDLESVKNELGLAYLASDDLALYNEVDMTISKNEQGYVVWAHYYLMPQKEGNGLGILAYSTQYGGTITSNIIDIDTDYQSYQWTSNRLETEVFAWITPTKDFYGENFWTIHIYFTRDDIAYDISGGADWSADPVEYAKTVIEHLSPID